MSVVSHILIELKAEGYRTMSGGSCPRPTTILTQYYVLLFVPQIFNPFLKQPPYLLLTAMP